MDILYLVDRLDNLIASSRRMPLVNQIIIRDSDILDIIDLMRTTIPDEIKQARRIIQEKERILAQARAEAANLLTRAREETERAMDREGLLRVAEERSQKLVQQAEEHAEQLKADADSYVVDTLQALREHLLSIETEVGRTILSIERGLESMEAVPIEVVEDTDEEGELSNVHSSHHPVPRRASLATDTTGGPTYQ